MGWRSNELERYRMGMFEAHGHYLLQRYLNPWAQQVLPRWQPPDASAHQPLALLVDDRPTSLVRFCVLNTLLMGRLRLRVRLYTTPDSLGSMEQLLADLGGWVELVVLPLTGQERLSWTGYNQLFKTEGFWSQQPADKLLIVQVDTLLIEPLDFDLFAYDYIGSPWSKGRLLSRHFPTYSSDLQACLAPEWESRMLCSTVPDGLVNGNGGLSIRKRDLMAEICAAELSEPSEPEDIFFGRCLERYAVQLPSHEVLRRFSCETHYQVTLGAHACWRYLEAAEQAEIYERHVKHLLALLAASQSGAL